MDLQTRINTSLKEAIKAKDSVRVSTLRLINAAIKDREIAARTSEDSDTGIVDSDVLQILGKMVKQRQESVRAYEEGGRLELAEAEQAEIAVLEGFLPKQLDERQTADAISAAISVSLPTARCWSGVQDPRTPSRPRRRAGLPVKGRRGAARHWRPR